MAAYYGTITLEPIRTWKQGGRTFRYESGPDGGITKVLAADGRFYPYNGNTLFDLLRQGMIDAQEAFKRQLEQDLYRPTALFPSCLRVM